jgi:predicted extracellular nuclease
LYVAFWNVENLFDTQDDPDNPGDDEFLPTSAKRWTPERFQIKVKNLAQVIQDMNDKKGPDVLGLCELENAAVVKALVAELAPLGRSYKLVHKDSPDKRGIDCAILYDSKKLKLASSTFLVVDAGQTREIVGAEFLADGKRLHVFANHWPSRGNPEEHRITAAKTLRRRLDTMLAVEPDADIVILGDLNDEPTNVSVKDHLKASGDPKNLPAGHLFNTTWALKQDPNEGTYVFQNKWEVIDNVIVSPGLLDTKRFRWKEASTKPVKFDYQMFKPSNPNQIPRPSRSYTGNSFHKDGYSDHLPIGCVIEF